MTQDLEFGSQPSSRNKHPIFFITAEKKHGYKLVTHPTLVLGKTIRISRLNLIVLKSPCAPLRTPTGCSQRCRARAGAAYILPRNATYWRCSVRKQRKCVISSGSIIIFSPDIFLFYSGRICLALSSFMHCFIYNIFRAEMSRAGLRS